MTRHQKNTRLHLADVLRDAAHEIAWIPYPRCYGGERQALAKAVKLLLNKARIIRQYAEHSQKGGAA